MTEKSSKKGWTLDATGGAVKVIGEALDLGNRREVLDALRIAGAILANGHLPSDRELRWIGRALENIGMQAPPLLEDNDALGRLVLRELGLTRKTRRNLQATLDRSLMVDSLQKQGLTREEALDVVARFNPETGALNAGPDDGEALKQAIKRLKRDRRAVKGTP